MPTISVSPADGCPGYLVSLDGTDRDVLVQTDWDYVGLARTFGASLRSLVRKPAGEPVVLSEDEYGQVLQVYWCKHQRTDGTSKCEDCGATPSEFIAAAQEYLDAGPDPVEDPGYFDNE